MKVSIIAVGTELLFGQTINTNAAYLSKNLQLMGFSVMHHYVVGDNPDRLRMQLAEAFKHADIVITTGGLGPTQDDLTKEIAAEYMGSALVEDSRVLSELHCFFEKRGRSMSENNIKQAFVPEDGTVFYNEAGTAPGCAIEKNNKTVVCLPGPPREMTWLFENGVKDYLEKFVEKRTYYKVIRTIGIGESDLETILLPLIDGQTDPTIATYAKEGECSIRVASQRSTIEEAREAVEEMISRLEKICGRYIYSYDDEEMKQIVVRMLKEKQLSISSAESCTGGSFAAAITDVPGASAVFGSGFVTYSIDAKVNQLGVDRALIESKGVVSAEVAESMAVQARLKSASDIAVSVTGYAGPDADPGYQAGDAFIGYAYEGKSGSIEIHRKSSRRDWNRSGFTLQMLRTVYMILKGEI